MARGDTISGGGFLTSSQTLTIRPASGDEWMITGVGSDATYCRITQTGGAGGYMGFRDALADDTSTSAADAVTSYFMRSNIVNTPVKWFLTNSLYISMRSSTTYHKDWFFGIKTKE